MEPAAASPEPAPSPEPSRRRRPVAPWIVLGVAVVLVAMVVVFTRSKPATDTAATPLLGQAAPLVTGTTLDGQTFDLGARRGNWVVLSFFGTWCPPCVQEHPELVQFARAGGPGRRRPARVDHQQRARRGTGPRLLRQERRVVARRVRPHRRHQREVRRSQGARDVDRPAKNGGRCVFRTIHEVTADSLTSVLDRLQDGFVMAGTEHAPGRGAKWGWYVMAVIREWPPCVFSTTRTSSTSTPPASASTPSPRRSSARRVAARAWAVRGRRRPRTSATRSPARCWPGRPTTRSARTSTATSPTRACCWYRPRRASTAWCRSCPSWFSCSPSAGSLLAFRRWRRPRRRGQAHRRGPRPRGRRRAATRERPVKVDLDALGELEEPRDFLLRSLDDLEHERAAGDMDEHDYETLRDGWTAAPHVVLRAIEGTPLGPAAEAARRWGRIVALVGRRGHPGRRPGRGEWPPPPASGCPAARPRATWPAASTPSSPRHAPLQSTDPKGAIDRYDDVLRRPSPTTPRPSRTGAGSWPSSATRPAPPTSSPRARPGSTGPCRWPPPTPTRTASRPSSGSGC